MADGWTLLQWINSEVQARQPCKVTIAEDMQDNERITRSLASGGAGFSAQWVLGSSTPSAASPWDMNALATMIEQRFNGDAFQRVLYSESHDEVAASNGNARLPEIISPGNADGFYAQKRSTLVAAIVMTVPGIP